MCGIVGHASIGGVSPLDAALSALTHRGPDHQGQRVFEIGNWRVALGHTRLSILDLSDAGHQPMSSRDGRFLMVFNGEIYNFVELRDELSSLGYTFRSTSDSEVLLAAWAEWGEDCLMRLNGMFAFAVIDRRTGTLTLARDAFGIKPLYFARIGEGIAFASEIRALQRMVPARFSVNERQAFRYLKYGLYDDEDGTFYDDVQRLPPGHLLRVDLQTGRCRPPVRWWDPSIVENRPGSFKQASEELRHRFLESVKIHMRSDVAVGAALSGGVDSSALVCAMRFLEPEMEIPTFSFISSDIATNERKWVELVNESAGSTAHYVSIDRTAFFADLDDLIVAQGEPFASTSVYAQYRVFKRVREVGITVTLDGQGADELLAGYGGYPVARLRSLLSEGQITKAVRFLHSWRQWPDRSARPVLKGLAMSYTPDTIRRMRSSRNESNRWLQRTDRDFPPIHVRQTERPPRGRHLAASLRDALTGQGLQALLRHGDRNSMRFSVESRVPFLSTGLAEFLLGQPERFQVSPEGETKRLLRAATRGIVPDEVLDRRDKIGFVAPQAQWLRQEQALLHESLNVSGLDHFLVRDHARDLIDDFIEGVPGADAGAVWRILNFARWLQTCEASSAG